MRQKQQGGFTLIEVTLFLAISGLLLLIAVFGMGPQLKQSQFTDSMQGIGSYINSQYNDIQTGVNNRKINISCTNPGPSGTHVVLGSGSNLAGGNENCVLLGRYYKFSATKITANDVVGAVDGDCVTDTGSPLLVQKLEKACATNVLDDNNSAQSHTFSWGNTLRNNAMGRVLRGGTTTFTNEGSYNASNAFGIYRDPDSGQIFTVLYRPNGTALPTSNNNAQFCFKGQVKYTGAIYFGGTYTSGGDLVKGNNSLVNVKVDDSSCNDLVGV